MPTVSNCFPNRYAYTHAGIVIHTLHLFDALAEADPEGSLAEVRQAAAGNPAEGEKS